ncbi:MAG: tetratricopeptide repeat protein [Rhodocyclaceae bacterium]
MFGFDFLPSLGSVPILGVGLHVLVAIYFGVHAVRHGQNMYWLLLLFIFPLLGSIVYFFAVYLPMLRGSRQVHVASRAITQALDPGRSLREARIAVERTPTVGNRMRLAQALLENEQTAEALALYEEAASGPFATDPALLRGLAEAQFASGRAAECATTLDKLFAAHPESRRQSALALLLAQALAAQQAPATRDAFEFALTVAADPEPKCRYADWLRAQGASADVARARALYDEIVSDARFWPKYARNVNREWLQRAQSGLAAL